MNIFLTSYDPQACAQALDDKRVVNQTLETAQLLCSALRMNGCRDKRLCLLSHQHHPVTKWVASSYAHWFWTYSLFMALGQEKLVRFPQNPPHKSWERLSGVLPKLAQKSELRFKTAEDETLFCNCARNSSLNLDFTAVASPVSAYRLYLMARWGLDKKEPRWSNRDRPDWVWPRKEDWVLLAREYNPCADSKVMLGRFI